MSLQGVLDAQYAAGRLPGAVAVVARPRGTEVAVVGSRSVGGPPMTRDSVFRLASITKPIVAAATMVLVERGVLGLDDAVGRWLPELAHPMVLRRADGPLGDVTRATRPVTVRDLLTLRGGHGFTADVFSPVAKALQERLHQGRSRPAAVPPTDEWMARLSEIPLVHQPGQGWTYNVSSDILGVLLARAEGTSLGAVLRSTVLEPVGMRDTGFCCDDLGRMTSLYQRRPDGFELVDPPDGQWASQPAFESGAGGLVSTVDDWVAFGRMLLADGTLNRRQVLTAESTRMMMTSHVEAEPDNPYLDGQGWGFGGGVDVRRDGPWNVIGRYGWVGGTGTAAYVIPSTRTVVVFLGQVELTGADDMTGMAEVLTYAAGNH